MLVIRLQRTGRTKQASYRLVVAEHSAPVKGKYKEIVGSYNPSEGKKFIAKQDRIEYWLSVGAKPSETVAGLLKFNGYKDMEKYMTPRTKKKPVKNPSEAQLAAIEAAKAPAVEEKTEEPAAEEASE